MKKVSWLSYLLGFITALLIFILISITQGNKVDPPEKPPIEEETVYSLPAPDKPEVDETPKSDTPDIILETPSDSEDMPEMPPVEQVDIPLDPQIPPQVIDPTNMLPSRGELDNDIEDLIDWNELDDAPVVTEEGTFQSPYGNKEASATGSAVIELVINETGKTHVIRVVECSHEEYTSAVKNYVNSTRFSSPMKDGARVKAKFAWPIEFPVSR